MTAVELPPKERDLEKVSRKGDPFIHEALGSNDELIRGIGECVLLAETELLAAQSRLERALKLYLNTSNSSDLALKLLECRGRVNDALKALQN